MSKRSDRLLGHQRNDGITVLCIQGLDGVSYRIDALAILTLTGSPNVSSGSYNTTSGKTFAVRLVVLWPSAVSPIIGVISEPA